MPALTVIHLIITIFVTFYYVNGTGFDYPAIMPPPNDVQIALVKTLFPFLEEYETPIIIRATHAIHEVGWNCLAVYHPTALDVLTSERFHVDVGEDIINNYGNSNTRSICYVYSIAMTLNYLLPESTDAVKGLITSFGLNTSLADINPDVTACDIDNISCLQDVANTYGFTPDIMASIVAFELINFLQNDGWNQDGDINKYGNECTANCRRFGDTTNYIPKNNPFKCNAKSKHWTPLKEDNEKGFFYHYDHVTPHIGRTVTPKTMSRIELEANSAPNPHYKYKKETNLVLERLKELATNDTQKMLVEFFDNKLEVGFNILKGLEITLGWSYEERQLWLIGFSATEHDSVIQSWLEKRRWDRIRPTTVIQGCHDDTTLIETYGGPFRGVHNIKRSEFQPYIRVMPHSEYPSASACICTSFQQYTDTLLQENYNIDSVEITLNFRAGSSKIETGVTPQQDLEVTFTDLTDYANTCSQSRLWGGMHFTASISGAHTLCKDIGANAYQFAISLLNGQPL